MFDKLVDVVVQFIDCFRFFQVIDADEQGILLRNGLMAKVLEPGLHWFWPMIYRVRKDNVATRLYEMVAQSLVTKDGKCVAAGIVVTSKIRNIERSILDVENVDSAIQDACQATLAELVMESSWDTLRTAEFADRLTTECRKLAFKYGMEIIKVRLHELAPLRTFRLIGSN